MSGCSRVWFVSMRIATSWIHRGFRWCDGPRALWRLWSESALEGNLWAESALECDSLCGEAVSMNCATVPLIFLSRSSAMSQCLAVVRAVTPVV